jgi:hypothetical protein
MKRPIDLEAVRRCYSITDTAFQSAGQFRIVQAAGGVYETP